VLARGISEITKGALESQFKDMQVEVASSNCHLQEAGGLKRTKPPPDTLGAWGWRVRRRQWSWHECLARGLSVWRPIRPTEGQELSESILLAGC
jgi:hypothetical protein